jgi:hypothetical protein
MRPISIRIRTVAVPLGPSVVSGSRAALPLIGQRYVYPDAPVVE